MKVVAISRCRPYHSPDLTSLPGRAPVIERLHTTFGHLSGVGLDLPGPVKA